MRRNAIASALRTGGNDQFPQPLESLGKSIARNAHHGALRRRQHDRMHAELDRFFDHPVELVGGDPRLHQRDCEGRFALNAVGRFNLSDDMRAVDGEVCREFAAFTVEQNDRITAAQP